MKKNILSVALFFLVCVQVQAQTELQASSKIIVDNGHEHAEITVHPWGGSHGLFFGAKVNYSGAGDLWHPNNTVHAVDPGQYNFGAFSMGYTAAGGLFSFYDGGLSTGSGNVVAWQPVLSFVRGGSVAVGHTEPISKFHIKAGSLGNSPGNKVDVFTLHSGIGNYHNNSFIDVYSYRNAAGNDWLTASTRIQQRIDGSNMGYVEFNPAGMPWGMALGTGNQNRFYINNDGQVGIGTSKINDNTYGLFVEKGIRTRRVKVDQTIWADYVFAPSYKLLSLKEVEAFIKRHQHLPDVPSAKEVQQNGLDLGENQAVLLKKIEELTLHLIAQNKQLEEQQKTIQLLNQRIEKLETKTVQ